MIKLNHIDPFFCPKNLKKPARKKSKQKSVWHWPSQIGSDHLHNRLPTNTLVQTNQKSLDLAVLWFLVWTNKFRRTKHSPTEHTSMNTEFKSWSILLGTKRQRWSKRRQAPICTPAGQLFSRYENCIQNFGSEVGKVYTHWRETLKRHTLTETWNILRRAAGASIVLELLKPKKI